MLWVMREPEVHVKQEEPGCAPWGGPEAAPQGHAWQISGLLWCLLKMCSILPHSKQGLHLRLTSQANVITLES